MGKSVMVRYRIEIVCSGTVTYTPMEWRTKTTRLYGSGFGKPTTKNIATWVGNFESSHLPNGVNSHLGPVTILSAKIIDQSTGEIVATWQRTPVIQTST